MKSLLLILSRLSLSFILLLAISCKKDASSDELEEIVYPVSFAFEGFKHSSNVLKASSIQKLRVASNSPASSQDEGFLYYWSFNSDNLRPDVKYSANQNPIISYNNGLVPSSFAQGYAFEQYAAGRALSITGAREILVKMPISDVIAVKSLGFDMGSSNTGPKDFEIYYSLDEGDIYELISSVNQFGSFVANSKTSFTYDLSSRQITAQEVWFKIVLKAGERGTAGNYNETAGVIRLDNLYLIGLAPTNQQQSTINKLYYFFFHKDKPDVIIKGETELVSLLNLNLPLGEYDMVFIANKSNSELIFPPNMHKTSDFYTSNMFINHEAEIYGFKGEIVVNKEVTTSVTMQRLYSQVKVEFTDNVDLTMIRKIVVSQAHEPFYYAPFQELATNPILDQSSIMWETDFELNRQIVFNQFMGVLAEPKDLKYTVEIYGSNNNVMRTISLASLIRNNIQLVFRGELLRDVEASAGFQIIKDENWNGSSAVDF